MERIITNYILLLFLSFFFIDFAYSANSSLNARCIESEWEALMEFKESLVNDSSSLSSWTGRDCCSWDEITCHDLTGHVLMIQVDYHYFNSTFSPWLFNLSRLEVLMMSNCGFLGKIPNMFGRLPSLTTLSLSSNSFASVFPDSLCSLKNLTEMDFTNSQLQGSLPVCVGNMTSLTVMYMGSNKLSGEIFGEFNYPPSITAIDLSDNLFNFSIPLILRNLTQLEYLDVSRNSLIGELSESFFEGLESLRGLTISENQFLVFNVSSQWIPPIHIQYLDMESVFFGTRFPRWLQPKREMKGLIMSNASISGDIPDWCLTAFPNLTYLDLSRNLLTGPLPALDANTSAYLYILKLDHNQITGSIPEELCNLRSLVTLSLANNQLTGRIPLCLGNLQKLEALDLGNNLISGLVPSELGSLGSLNLLHLNGNKLFGELPSSLQNLDSLITLDLGGNEFQGSISIWIGKEWSSLQYLRLESNNFSSEIPANLCRFPSLHILNLAHNNLSGRIPPCLGNLSNMLSDESGPGSHINIYTDALLNYVKGAEMEYSWNLLRFAKFISLSSNHLHGEIPPELMNLKGLQSLNLSKNELTGRIPEMIGNLQDLESLDLSMNRLSGTIPQSLAHVDALSYLNISFNNLAGKIPLEDHFDTFTDPSIYEGNEGLCGKVLKKSCPGEDAEASHKNSGANDSDDDHPWIYAGIGPGFAVGFLGVICVLYFKHPWRVAYFGFVDNVYNRVWVTFAIKISQIKRKFSVL